MKNTSKDKFSNQNPLNKCMEKVIDRYPDASCKMVSNMSSCIQMCEKIGKVLIKILMYVIFTWFLLKL